MRTIFLSWIRLLFIYFLFVSPLHAQVNPAEQYGELFEAVQLSAIFPDSKTFPDCIPLHEPQAIMEDYQQSKGQADFDLEDFVLEHFQLPKSPSVDFQTDTANTIVEHINALWPVLTRSPSESVKGSLILLPESYIVPGGRFREIYYWDSYFTMLGLQVSKEYDLIRNMVDNFSFLIETLGFIPNGNRTYYTSRSQPPFYSLMVRLLADIEGDSVLVRYLPQLEKEYAFWMNGTKSLDENTPAYRRVVRLDDGTILNRYWDDNPAPRPESYKEDYELAHSIERDNEDLYRNIRAACESGWDFSSRWLRDGESLASIHTTEIIPIDLNSLMYHLERTLVAAYAEDGQLEKQMDFNQKAEQRAAAIRRYCWDKKQKFFLDYDFVAETTVNQPSLAAVFPLFFEIASKQEAVRVSRKLRKEFMAPGGLLTTLANTGQQWDAPNGWAPLQWVAYQALLNYDQNKPAKMLAERWIDNNVRVFQNTGKMVEKYVVTDISLEAGGGEYPVQDGFGWSNGVLLKMMSAQDME
ncbi:alpha,alpha-trehalase [Catalinimonas alkaloidigena]|uniref:alpha,alpha-trehalase TreF n=1 Tax=Catalinimonas alkaloidigena TaxID=1075417 RepID=UPI0024058430|nr:alpha,alpha-trehalase TreF [Catalinimonas alkaloidigena]MDF9797557.1 alpha,alpha-trehalase [Catalinimonas alkaloidigena]